MPNEINTNDRFTAASHFFADVSGISQNSAQSFGPISENQFRLTAKFTAQAGTKAYSICPGIVAIQPQAGSTTKVNLILRPFQQPIKGVNIRYFIYRGLNRSDFIGSNGNIIPITSGVSDFIQKINTDFNDFHANEQTPPEFDAAFIGFHEALADLSAPMDNLFFSITQYQEQNGEQVEVPESAFELPKIEMGKSLGTFAAGECGIDVVLQYGDFLLNEPDRFAFDYHYARAAEAIIDLTSVSDPVIRKRRKEQLFQFIDIAAFYGFHCLPSGSVTTAGNVKHDAAAIYSQVLTPFATKNTYYLYIQADRERSYDFYGTYRIDPQAPENMRYGTAENALAARAYVTNGWPVILETGAQTHTETRNKIFLQLVTDNNPNTVLYGQTACVDNALRNHFSTLEQLKQPVDENSEQPKLTTTIILSNPAVEDGSAKKHIANFGILIYQGVSYSYISGTEVNEENETVNVYAQPNFFDDVFGNLGALPLLKRNGQRFDATNFERLQLMNHFFNGESLGVSALQTTAIHDTIITLDELVPLFDRAIYITSATNVANSPLTPTSKISSDIQTPVNSVMGNKTFELPEKMSYKTGIITDNSESVTTLQLLRSEPAVNSDIIIGLSKTENDGLVILGAGLINPRLILINTSSEEERFVSLEAISYNKYNAAVAGEDPQTGELIVSTPQENIFIYSLDGFYFFSKTYSDNMTKLIGIDLLMDFQPSFLTNLPNL